MSSTRSDNTVRRPARLFIAALLPSYFPRLLTFLLSILPVDWPRGERGKAFRLAVGNLVLLRHDRPAQAWHWHWMERVPRSTEEYFLGAFVSIRGSGACRKRSRFRHANERDFAQAEALGVAHLPFRVLDEIWARHIGDAAILDYVIKLATASYSRSDTSRFLGARNHHEGAVGLGRDQHGKLVGRLRGKARRREADAGAGRREPIEIFRIVEKRDVGRARAIERRIRPRLGAGELDDLLDRQIAVGWEEIRHSTSAEDMEFLRPSGKFG